jgi:glutamine amidotransferase
VGGEMNQWTGTLLGDIEDGESMYFVHSYMVKPMESDVVLAKSTYGDITFCSSLQTNNIFACQFHPERSGPSGVQIYKNLARTLRGL